MNQISDILNGEHFSDLHMEELPVAEKTSGISHQMAQVPNQSTRDEKNTEIQQSLQQDSTKESQITNLEQIKRTAYAIKDQVEGLLRLLQGEKISPIEQYNNKIRETESVSLPSGEQIVEGVFNGEKMVGPDGKEYAVAPNYASKSKLVEGDMMKLSIKANGQFLFKQIGPCQRKRIIGVLRFDEESQKWTVEQAGRMYKILTASATFYKGKPGDEVVLIVPEDAKSDWGAVENIISK
ncbi:MAG: hypothetical protein HYY51_04610 [Candidatus Magasanikbacteria bacterium]|nr:hypothetical protein [Candidatus Magasanikbacteria bacterium]